MVNNLPIEIHLGIPGKGESVPGGSFNDFPKPIDQKKSGCVDLSNSPSVKDFEFNLKK